MTRKIKILDIIKNSRNFAEIYTKLNEIEPTSIEKGYTLELLTYYVFKLHPFYKDLCKNIWLYNDIPDNVKSLLKLPEKDMGIDLLLETHNSKYNNIQCKYRSNRDIPISYTELSTALTQTHLKNLELTYIVTNVYDIEEETSKSDKVIYIYNEFLYNLTEEFFINVKNFIEFNKEPEYIKKILRPYQKECLDLILKHHGEYYESNITMACGTGKSLLIKHVDSLFDNKLSLILVPSLYLLSQFYHDLKYEYEQTVKFLLIA